MQPVIYELILLAQLAQHGVGMRMFKWGVTGVGVAILIAAAGVAFSKPKHPKKEMAPAVKVIAALLFAALGCGIIAYAWLAF